jgi:hypothetical protein
MRKALALTLALAAPAPAAAFCGFFVSGADSQLYNDASQVALMRQGTRTVMTMSNNYRGPPEDFAMVVPVPVVLKQQQVKTLPRDVFQHIDQLSAPRLVEYWEQDPCWKPPPVEEERMVMAPAPSGAAMKKGERDLGVKIEARFQVGEYKILILSAKESTGLETWLRLEKYKIPSGAAAALAPYVQSGMKFFVAKVDIAKVAHDDTGAVVLSPLRFDYESPELRLPVRLGLLNAHGKQDLIVYVLHPNSRFEAANYKNVFIPSNVEVTDEVRHGFGSFYAQLFDETLARAGGRAVVTEYAWQTSSCDPCPVPPLTPSDLYTLGGDVLGAGEKGSPGPAPSSMPGQGYYGPASDWVLTRLHTRYDAATLSEDILFTPARPVVGGRSGGDGTGLEQPGAVQPDSVNNFQGRYIIRHYWNGPVACKDPVWGRWGGPPDGGGTPAVAATGLAQAPRGQMTLQQVVRSALPQLDLKGQAPPEHPKQ